MQPTPLGINATAAAVPSAGRHTAPASAAAAAAAPSPPLPPTVAAAAAAAAAAGRASPSQLQDAYSAKGGRLQDVAAQSQGLHQNLDQLLKDSHQGLDGPGWAQSEEAAELAHIRRIRESWKGLVAPKAQRCSHEGAFAYATRAGRAGSSSSRVLRRRGMQSCRQSVAASGAMRLCGPCGLSP